VLPKRNLNLHRNPICEEKQYQEKVQELLPKMHILDAHPIVDIQKHQNTNMMSSKRNNPIREGQEDAIEDANDTSKRVIPRQSKGIEDKVKKEQKTSLRFLKQATVPHLRMYIHLVVLGGVTNVR
jgi:hypothetical protein